MRKWFKRMAPDQEKLLANRWLRPIAHRLGDPQIWHFNRHSVARGVALGLFAGFILPIGQIFLAAIMAASVRSNVMVASATTLVTNPFTFPPIYYAAWKAGAGLLGMAGMGQTADGAMAGMIGASLPLVVGLLVFAVVSSVTGYLAVQLGWRVALALQWRRRRLRG